MVQQRSLEPRLTPPCHHLATRCLPPVGAASRHTHCHQTAHPGAPYRHATWLPWKVVEAKRGALLRSFVGRQADGDADSEWAATHNINPLWYQVDRVIAHSRGGGSKGGSKGSSKGGSPARYLVKWAGLEYSECTWEEEAEVTRDGAGKVGGWCLKAVVT